MDLVDAAVVLIGGDRVTEPERQMFASFTTCNFSDVVCVSIGVRLCLRGGYDCSYASFCLS